MNIQNESRLINSSIEFINDSIFINTLSVLFAIVMFVFESSLFVKKFKNDYVFFQYRSVDDAMFR